MDALRSLPGDFQTWAVETEFWGAMASPNLMVEVTGLILPTSSPHLPSTSVRFNGTLTT